MIKINLGSKYATMDPTIRKILLNHRVDGVFHTHVSLIEPLGRFQFDRRTLEEFWDVYCQAISQNPDTIVGIAEKPQQYLPVLVDVDLKIRADGDNQVVDGLYDEDQLQTIVQIYQTILKEIVEDCADTDLICVVLEKDMYQVTKNDSVFYKNGFHLHFPYLFLSNVDQEMHLIPRVQTEIAKLNLFEKIGIDSSTVIDKACCKVPWLLYGSRKSQTSQPYRVTKIYNHNMEKISLEKAFRSYSIFNHRDELMNLRGQVQQLLPRILSIIPHGRTTKEMKKGVISPLKQKMKEERRKSSHADGIQNIEANLAVAKRLLPMLKDERATNYTDWMTVGWILHNISEGNPDGLDLWLEFSARCEEKYDENHCIYQWSLMTKRDLGLGTLRYFANHDNPEEYKKYKQEKAKKHLEESLAGSHNDVAKMLRELYYDEFRCVGISGNSWYQFRNHKWEQIEEGVFLRKKISEDLPKLYTDGIKKLYDEMNAAETDKPKQDMISQKIKQYTKMISNLKNNSYKNSIMKECRDEFYDERFKERLDSNPYLICFRNGVYDLQQNVHRTGRPDDYISKSMPIEYHHLSEEDEKVQDVHTFLEQVFPDKSVRKYFLDVSSDVFVGGNQEKIVQFWTGEGDNGKSITQMFFEQMLGNLLIKLNTNLITGKKPSSGAAYPELARAGGGVRQVVLEEPDGDEAINVGFFKHLSGNDSFYARDLFERGKDTKEIKPMFKLVFVCNKLPRIKYADKAVWNRVRVIPFESTFCRPDNPAPESYEEQLRQKRFPMDKQFAKKIPGLVEAFAWILLQHRQKIQNRFEPDKVRAATEMYRKQNDFYRQFTDEVIIDDAGAKIGLLELYNVFKNWFRESLPNHPLPIKNEVEEYFCRVWGNPSIGKQWAGHRLRTQKDDIDNGEAIILEDDDYVDYSKETPAERQTRLDKEKQSGLPPI